MVEAILIAGPTASGKSALAISLAQKHRGLVINADSMQVYGDLRVITARPTREEEASAPHRLFGHVDAAQNYSVGRWLDDARAALAEARALSLTPIVVGGTGLYFKALLRGLSDMPAVPDSSRATTRAQAQDVTTPDLHARLAARDPAAAARLRPSDRQRILRALEVFDATGQSITAFQARAGAASLDAGACVCVFLAPDRAALRARIDARFDTMMGQGAREEVRALAARGLDPALPAMRAHGVPGLIAHERGALSLEEAIAKGKRDTRQYARRQFTWFRHQLPEFAWTAPETALAHVEAQMHAVSRRSDGG